MCICVNSDPLGKIYSGDGIGPTRGLLGKTLTKITEGGREDKEVTTYEKTSRSTTYEKRERREDCTSSPRPQKVSASPIGGCFTLKVPIRGIPSRQELSDSYAAVLTHWLGAAWRRDVKL